VDHTVRNSHFDPILMRFEKTAVENNIEEEKAIYIITFAL